MIKSNSTTQGELYRPAVMPNIDTRMITLPGKNPVQMPIPVVDPLKFKKNPDKSTPAPTNPNKIGDIDALERIIENLYKFFAPDEIEYAPRSDEEIADSISDWLRPGYDQAISDRKDMTKANNANLDADAIARGMGSSTYVSDVKSRQQNAESDDIAKMESDYGANFSKYMQENIAADQDRLLEVQKINAELRDQAYQRAYDAALILFNQYKKNPKGFKFDVYLSPSEKDFDKDIVHLDDVSRTQIFSGSTAEGAQYRAQLKAKVGSRGFDRLAQKYAV
jgi:hypothetical protein